MGRLQRMQRKGWAIFSRKKAESEDAPAPTPRVVPAQVISVVEPAIPAHFLARHLHRDQIELAFWAVFTIHADGTSTVEATESTGNDALDALALEAARRWQFQPARQDGAPVESTLRLKIKFDTALPAGRRIDRKGRRY